MSDKEKLEQQLWRIADTLRGKMDADDFRDYILGFIFYKYLSEKMYNYANSILKPDKLKYEDLTKHKEKRLYLKEVKEAALDKLGYFLEPSEMFSEMARRGNAEGKSKFILDDLTKVLNHIEQSTMGTESEEEFGNLFEDLDLTSSKLGKTEQAKNDLIVKVLSHLNEIDFDLDNVKADVLGDAYEYLIGKFASGAGKTAGEFYTPQQVSVVLARLVTVGKNKLKNAYDPTCGSGSLLLRVAKEVKEVGKFYGQESNPTTYNLCRMNMIMHGIHYRKFDIKHDDTLERPQHEDIQFEAIVANPPFSAKWTASPLFLTDDRFASYGRLAPNNKADFAFIQHMVHQLANNGTMACIMPHGILSRGGAEGHIREYLIKEKNYLDAVIGLPPNIFYGTGIPTCILVLKKEREHKDNVLFIDASQHFEKVKNQNVLRYADIDKISMTYKARNSEAKYSSVSTLTKIATNGYNLNIPRYVETVAEEKNIDVVAICNLLVKNNEQSKKLDREITLHCADLGIPSPSGYNSNLLKLYKRGVTQQLFAKRLRFKADSGKPFPKWGERKLCEVLDYIQPTKFLVESTEYSNAHSIPVLTAGKTFILGYTNEGENVYNEALPVILFDDFTTATQFVNFPFKAKSSAMKILTARQGSNISFVYEAMQLIKFEVGGHGRHWISQFSLLTIPYPCIDEQQKIAHFLSILDLKIQTVTEQITEANGSKINR